MSRLPKSVKLFAPPADPEAVRTLSVVKAKAAVNIDGKIEEADWNQVPFSGNFHDSKARTPALNETAVKALFDDKNLYLAIACADRDPGQIKAEAIDEASIFASKDDAIALMIQPDENVPVYYQMAFNTEGIQFDQKVKGGERDYVFHPDWKAVTVKGEKMWTAEVVFPFEAFGLKNGKGKGPWRINVFRVMRDNILPPSAWTLPGKDGGWHNTERFGKVDFKK
jgi:hypothetical protein